MLLFIVDFEIATCQNFDHSFLIFILLQDYIYVQIKMKYTVELVYPTTKYIFSFNINDKVNCIIYLIGIDEFPQYISQGDPQ